MSLQGKSQVKTLLGGMFTLLITMQILGYAAITLVELVNRQNPSIVEVNISDHFDSKYRLPVQRVDQKFAISIRSYMTKKLRNDTRYIKLIAR